MDESNKALLREEQTRLIKIVSALEKLDKSKEWSSLKELVFDKSLESIERQIKNIALSPIVDTNKLYNLQGQWSWARQFCDIDGFAEQLKKQLEEIKKRL